MTPRLKSGQSVIVESVTEETLISNSHGYVNETISRKNIFGKVIRIID